MERAVTPSDADVLVARGVIRDLLATRSEPVLVTEFEDEWLRALGVRRPTERTPYQAHASEEPDRRLADPDPSDPHLATFRARHAVRRALGQLLAEGWIARGDGNQYGTQTERIPVEYPGGGSSVEVVVISPLLPEPGSGPRYMAVRPVEGDGADVLLPVEDMLTGLETVLGPRGVHLVRESRRSLRAGLFLASSSLLAAASEAAWFNVARAVQQPGGKLRSLVEDGKDIAEVIRLTEQHLQGLKIGRSTVTEVVAQAHLFRDIRNYALHPVEDHDADREAWLTETGATMLTIAARRYFLKLTSFREALTAPPAPEESNDPP